jgi:hypothetical protein
VGAGGPLTRIDRERACELTLEKSTARRSG